MKRTTVDFSRHELITEFNNSIKMWKLKIPNSSYEHISFVNTQGVLLVTGDFGNHVFCREFHPTADGYVSDEYWCEKYRIATEEKTHEYDDQTTEKLLLSGIRFELEEYGYEGDDLKVMKEYYRDLLEHVYADEWEYIGYAYNEYMPGVITAEDVPFCQKIKYRLLIVFDAFEEICKRMKESEGETLSSVTVSGTPQPLEGVARKLFGFNGVPKTEQKRMVNRAIKVLQDYKKEN